MAPHPRAGLGWRIIVSATALMVLVSTGFGWYQLQALASGLSTSDALGDGPRSQDGATNILLIGLDSRKDQQGNDLPQAILDQLHAGDGEEGGYNTNTLILLHVPDDGSKITAFSIPRDDYVPVKGIPDNDHVKIKEAYGLEKYYTEQRLAATGVTDKQTLETKGREAGRAETLQTVRDVLGVPIDRFAEINLAGFYDVAQALGGVDVCLNHPVDDDYSGASFPAGPQTLNASQALAFVRQRHGLDNGDLDRTHRQQAFLVSAMHKLQSAGTFVNPGKLQNLLDVAKRDVLLSSGWDIGSYAQQLGKVAGSTTEFQTLPVVRYDTIDGQDVNIVDIPAIRAQVRAAFGMSEPTTTSPAKPPTSTVDVVNAGETPGLATDMSKALVADGFAVGAVGNATSRDGTASSVTYGPGSDADAETASALLGDLTITPDPTLPPGHIRIVLGRTFTPPAGPNASTKNFVMQSGPSTRAANPGTAGPTATSTPATPPPDQGSPIDGGTVPCVD
jgi:LCP family protein required for cell wall assembly